eukprot:1895542-Rhodomonas_salina.1
MAFFSATFATYPGSGYMLDIENAFVRDDGEVQLNTIPWGQSDHLNVTFSELKNSRWIDLKTLAVFFDFTFCTKPFVGVRARCGHGAHCGQMCGLVLLRDLEVAEGQESVLGSWGGWSMGDEDEWLMRDIRLTWF